MTSNTDLMTRVEAAAYLTALGCPISPSSLAKLAVRENAGGGPPFLRSGWKTVRYQSDDLQAWAAKKVVRVE